MRARAGECELFGGDESITEEEFYAYKYDTKYSESSPVNDLRKEMLEAIPEDHLTLYLEHGGEGLRTVRFCAGGPESAAWLQRMQGAGG